jgi:hypothetical protein
LSITPYMNQVGYCSKFTLLQKLFLLLLANVAVGNLRWLSTQVRWVPTGTTVGTCGNGHGCEHVGRQLKRLQCTRHKYVERKHVPGTNMSGSNMYRAQTCRAPTCTRCEHVRRQLKGANLTPFSQKTPQDCHFLLQRPK